MTKDWQTLYNLTQPLLAKYYPHYQSAKDWAKDFLQKTLTPGQLVLDLGCGHHSEDFTAVKNRIKLIGVDFDPTAGQDNKLLDEFKQADLNNKLPFSDNCFDLVYSRFVVEHLAQPQKTYQEVYRILKSGQYFVILAPNLYNPIIFLSKILPSAWHGKIKRRLTGTKETEVYPTYYRSNTAARIKKQLRQVGFKEIQVLRRGGMFEYFMANKFLFVLAIYCEKLMDLIAKFKKLHLIVIAQK
jgi:ubiquinone/menaquinone biosynthesis C-methylase UbiE